MNTVLSFRYKFRIIVILTFFFTIRTGPLLPQSYVDTLWADKYLDGIIAYFANSQLYHVNPIGVSLDVGDGWDWFGEQRVFFRSYVSFDISSLPLDSAEFHLISAELGLYQIVSVGNGAWRVFPIWDVPGGDTLYCIVDHIDFGDYLDPTDWTAGDEGDSATLLSNIGVLSDSENIEYKKLDVTEQVTADIDSGRTRSQYRIRFPILTDDPPGSGSYTFDDYLMFRSANTNLENHPYIRIVYDFTTGVKDYKRHNVQNVIHIKAHPNPFNNVIELSYYIPEETYAEIEITDLIGRSVRKLARGVGSSRSDKLIWDGTNYNGKPQPSGVYFVRVTYDNKNITKKILLIR